MGQFDNRRGVSYGGGFRYGPQPGMTFGSKGRTEIEPTKTLRPTTIINPDKLERKLLKNKKLRKNLYDLSRDPVS